MFTIIIASKTRKLKLIDIKQLSTNITANKQQIKVYKISKSMLNPPLHTKVRVVLEIQLLFFLKAKQERMGSAPTVGQGLKEENICTG